MNNGDKLLLLAIIAIAIGVALWHALLCVM